jgi:hypothetical protein
MNNTPAPNSTDCASGQRVGDRLSGFTNHRPVAANRIRMASFAATMIVSPRPMILAPKALTMVRASTEATARTSISSGACGSAEKVAA